MISYQEAQHIIARYAKSFGTEKVTQEKAHNRILAESIKADRDYPPFNRATMDGYAIRFADFSDGINKFKVKEIIYAGYDTDKILQKGECFKIMTGASVPDSADTVIRKEDVSVFDLIIELQTNTIKQGQSIAPKAGDLKQNDIILEKGIQLSASAMGGLAVVGSNTVQVQKLPSVIIYSTGDEVITEPVQLLPQQIRESNSNVLMAMLKKFEIHSVKRKHLADNENEIYNTIKKDINNDIIIISGGISAGDADYVPSVLEKLRVKKLIQHVAIRPGKPFWFGIAENGTTVFALPGNPVSAQVCYKLFVEHYLRTCFGLGANPIWQLPLVHQRNKKVKLDEFFPCKIQQVPFGIRACSFNTSGDITSTILSDGLGIQQMEKELINENELIDFIHW